MTDARPRVLILGGGFGGIGAARKLKGADVDVVLVDRHDYHTFQPLLYQVATDLLETSAVGHALRDLFHDQPNVTIHQATVSAIDLEAKQVSFEEMGPLGYDYLVLALGAKANFFGTPGARRARLPDVHARRRRAPARARARALGGGRPRSLADRRRRAQRGHRRRRPDGRRERRRARRALPEQLRQGLPLDPTGEGTPDPRRGGPRAVLHVSRGSAGLRGALAEAPHRRGDDRRGRSLGRADPRDAEVGRGDPGPHARLGRRSPGEPGRRRARSRPRARPSNPGRARPDGAGPSGAVRRRRHRLDHRCEGGPRAPAARLGRAPGRRARRRDDRPARQGQGGEAVRLPRQGHDGGDRPWRRGRAVPGRPHHDGLSGACSRGARCTWRCSRRARIARRRSSTGCGPGSPTSAPDGSE